MAEPGAADNLVTDLRAALAPRYVVGEPLGQGGMALVFLADDVKHGRRVAVKVLHPELAEQVGPGRFLSEIAISASLAHPNIIPLLDSGDAGGALYYVMPLIEGESVRERLAREGPLPVDEALHIARGVAAALDYAHGRGILHRDIKPENVLLVAGEPVVADFGIAKALLAGSDRPGATAIGYSVGTPAYMSPEQACGDPGLDGRSDIYSLGCLLFEMLTGELPFGGPTPMAITASKLTDATPLVSARRHAVPPDVDAVVMRALSRVAAERYATARDLAQALDAVRAAPAASEASPAETGPVSLAVLPFVNVGAGADDEFLADGITEALIHALSEMPGVRVVARTSAFAFKGRTRDIREIGGQLAVGVVLEGSIRRSGNRLRVTTQLVDVADGLNRWSARYDRVVDDVFALEDDIAHEVAEALAITLTGAPAARPAPAANFAAYELYLRGRHAWNRRTEPELRHSLALYREALAADPGFARAFAGLADSYVTLGIYGLASPAEVMPAAREAAEQAIALDAGSAEARTSLACVQAVYDWDWSGAETEFRRAIEAGPGYPTARHWYAMHCLAPRGRLAEARAELEAARANDPLSPTINVSLGLVSLFERDTERARREVEHVIELDPGFGFAHYVLGQVCESQGRHAEAVAAFRAARPLLNDSAELLAALARALATAGDGAAAGELLEQLQSRETAGFVSPVLLAQVLLALGRRDEGLAALDEALTVRSCDLMWLRMQPAFDELRGDPRFEAIVRRVGLMADGW